MRWGWVGSGALHGGLAGAAFLAGLARATAPEAGLDVPPPAPLRIETPRPVPEAPRFEIEAVEIPPSPDVLAAFEPDRPEPEPETLKATRRPEPDFDRPLVTVERLAPPPAAEVETETGPVEVLNPPPAYPTPARRRRIEGHALVEVIVRVDGTCADPRLLECSGSRLFGEAALEAVRNWRYRPASIGGRPVERLHTIRFTFRLR